MMKQPYRMGQLLLCMMSCLVLFASFYFQWIKGLEPCPLCVMQRACVMLLFILSFMSAFLTSLRARHVIFVFECLVVLSGLYFALRQLWLQSLPPDKLPACLPGLDILLHYFPWQDIIRALIWGSADCGEVTWEWLGLSMPAWSALYFALSLIGLALCRRNWKN